MQLQEAHQHQQLNGQKPQGMQTRLSRCLFLTNDQEDTEYESETETEQCGVS